MADTAGEMMMMMTTPAFFFIVIVSWSFVNSNPTGEVYSIQHYVIKLVSDLRQVGGFLQVLQFPPPIKLNDITEILLKAALNTITRNASL